VLQVSMFDGLPFYPFALLDDGLGPSEVDIGVRHIFQVLFRQFAGDVAGNIVDSGRACGERWPISKPKAVSAMFSVSVTSRRAWCCIVPGCSPRLPILISSDSEWFVLMSSVMVRHHNARMGN
jgi:hypothetical protein